MPTTIVCVLGHDIIIIIVKLLVFILVQVPIVCGCFARYGRLPVDGFLIFNTATGEPCQGQGLNCALHEVAGILF